MTDATTPPTTGRVLLVGGGPGDPGLLTLAGRDALAAADVVVTDRLAPIAAIAEHAPRAEVIHVGKIPRGEFTPQERINELLVEHARAGRVVVRLKGGDGYLFGRGGEEWQHCVAAGVPVEAIPGVSSAFSVPALAGIPVTHRGLSQGVAVVSGHVAPEDPRSEVDWAALATSRLTIVVLMGVATLGSIAETLIAAGLSADTPAACIADGASPQQRSVRAPLSQIAAEADAGGFAPPAITVIGEVVDALEPPSAAAG
ncbi:uroporphyrinogen-III C-methyltransferase [Janibacter anophelis]|uniref:uroporphyrinogen-III C-methyltransferase n=1 Tax=Janibacter anophelis TaxID=319054 RepID=UPI000DEEC4C2|nr:uroporphyrinogen-III C-methyltransferase [Janibacter anophelis]